MLFCVFLTTFSFNLKYHNIPFTLFAIVFSILFFNIITMGNLKQSKCQSSVESRVWKLYAGQSRMKFLIFGGFLISTGNSSENWKAKEAVSFQFKTSQNSLYVICNLFRHFIF